MTSTAPIWPLRLYYFAYYAAVGVLLPYLPQHLRALGLSGREIGILTAISPLFTLACPPLWGLLADRTRRAALLLGLASLGYALSFARLLVADRFASIAAVLALSSFFSAPIVMLVDSLTLERLPHKGDYSRVRVFGSLGFIVATAVFGQFYSGERGNLVITVTLALLAAEVVISLAIRGEGAHREHVGVRDAVALLRDRRVLLLLVATGLHWLACSPYHMLFTVYLKSLGIAPRVAGIAFGAGVAAEVVVMMVFPQLAARFSLPKLLALSFGASSIRWLLVGLVHDPTLLVLLQLLHGLTFGLFLCAAVAWVGVLVPERLRATGQALYVAITYGVGGVLGYLATGEAFDVRPAGELFLAAGAFEWLPLLLVLSLPPPAVAVEPGAPVVQSSET